MAIFDYEGILDDSSTYFPILKNAVTFFKQHGYSEVKARVVGGESEWNCGICSYSATYPTLEEMSKQCQEDYCEEKSESSGWTLTVAGYVVDMKKDTKEVSIFYAKNCVIVDGDDESVELFKKINTLNNLTIKDYRKRYGKDKKISYLQKAFAMPIV